MKQMYKVCIVFVLLVASYCMGCVDNSNASTDKLYYDGNIGRFTIQDYMYNYNSFGCLWVVHDDKNNVTLYITQFARCGSGGIAAVPDSMLDKNN